MCVCFVSVKVTLKRAGSFFLFFFFVKAEGPKVVQREESLKIFCCHRPLLLPQSVYFKSKQRECMLAESIVVIIS